MESEAAETAVQGRNQTNKTKMHYIPKNKRGFTLVEIMIVVAIIALLAAIAVPNFLRARKRSVAGRILEDLRLLDAALDQYAIEHNRPSGAPAAFTDLQPYIKTGTVLYDSTGLDLYGNQFNNNNTYSVDTPPKVSTTTFNSLSDVAPAEFWSPYH